MIKLSRRKYRWLQIISGFHLVFHTQYAFGWKLPFLRIAYFGEYSKRCRKEKYKTQGGAWHSFDEIHDCTKLDVY